MLWLMGNPTDEESQDDVHGRRRSMNGMVQRCLSEVVIISEGVGWLALEIAGKCLHRFISSCKL